jgi:hypothetical protein
MAVIEKGNYMIVHDITSSEQSLQTPRCLYGVEVEPKNLLGGHLSHSGGITVDIRQHVGLDRFQFSCRRSDTEVARRGHRPRCVGTLPV